MEVADVCHILRELGREALAQHGDAGDPLLFADLLILLLVGLCLQALPGKSAPKEVHEDVA